MNVSSNRSRLFPPGPWRRAFTPAVQAVCLALVWVCASAVTRLAGLSISAGVVGLLFVPGLLLAGLLDVRWIKSGAAWLLGELILFFIPSIVAVVQYQDLMRQQGLRLLFAIAAGTILVMTCTAVAVHAGGRLERRLARGRASRACAVRGDAS